MYGHVVAHSDDPAGGVEHGAGVIAALFDVRGERSTAKGGAHLFGNREIEVLENLEFDGVTHGCDECTPKLGARIRYTSLSPPLRRFPMLSLTVVIALLGLSLVGAAKDESQVNDFVKQHLNAIGTDQARAA